MKINATKKVEVEAKTLLLHCKIRDCFTCTVHDQDGQAIKEYDGYVPSFMPGAHYGDYIILDIDIDTGQIKNWDEINKDDLKAFIEAPNNEDGEE